MSAKIPLPGSPALAPTYIATVGGDRPGSSITDANKVTPLKTFSYVVNGGSTTFYSGMPRVVSPYLKAALLAAGLVS